MHMVATTQIQRALDRSIRNHGFNVPRDQIKRYIDPDDTEYQIIDDKIIDGDRNANHKEHEVIAPALIIRQSLATKLSNLHIIHNQKEEAMQQKEFQSLPTDEQMKYIDEITNGIQIKYNEDMIVIECNDEIEIKTLDISCH
eukprot:707802_1